jgi:endonuclease/exonuclease/phosphatase family metal-dependent hydrolase
MRRVDFALVHPDWNLPMPEAFFAYDAASDHLPLVVDLNLHHTGTAQSTTVVAGGASV